jgi:hypothetical protein
MSLLDLAYSKITHVQQLKFVFSKGQFSSQPHLLEGPYMMFSSDAVGISHPSHFVGLFMPHFMS